MVSTARIYGAVGARSDDNRRLGVRWGLPGSFCMRKDGVVVGRTESRVIRLGGERADAEGRLDASEAN